jgi:ribonucleoside-triphosphate reductase
MLLSNRPEPFKTELAKFVYVRTYARWDNELQRRENWSETVNRATEFLFAKAGSALSDKDRLDITEAIYDHRVLPSMRLMWSAGKAAAKNNISIFNCAYAAMNDTRIFDEALLILMSGTGFGFSVESQYIESLPQIKPFRGTMKQHRVEDTREGWANALRLAIETSYAGGLIVFDYSLLRPSGAILKTMGGRSSGPEPLQRLLDFVQVKIKSRAGRRLRTIDVHDLMCMIGEVVVSGGVRRSSLISLSDVDDLELRNAKFGPFWNSAPYRAMSNNSVAYNEQPESAVFMEEFLSLVKSNSGERGIFNRTAILSTSPRRKEWENWGTNPCGEINLRSREFCNLSSVIARPDDNFESLSEKIRLATIIGTIQSTFTDFKYIGPEWKQNCDDERLLGVSITGQMDCPFIYNNSGESLAILRQFAIKVNKKYAKRLGINQSVAITTGKPAGTESQVVFSGSGAHTWWSKFFIRRVRISSTDPLFKIAREAGIPAVPEVGQEPMTATTWVLEFPVKAPEAAITRHDFSAKKQFEHWLRMKKSWCEHNQSVTIYCQPDDWIQMQSLVYDNWKHIGGISFLPTSDSIYRLAPYEDITEKEYEARKSVMPVINYELLNQLEQVDNTIGGKELACGGGSCELI